MQPPEFLSPSTLEEALSMMAQTGGTAVLAAGCTDLLPRLRLGSVTPGVIIDLGRLPRRGVRLENDRIVIDAWVTHTELLASDLVVRSLPALACACRSIGGPAVRNRGTLGGNLVNASPAADTAPPLLVYEAEVVLACPGGLRTLPLSGFLLGPGRTALAPGEILAEVRVPVPPPRTAAAFLKLGRRQAMAIAVASAAVRLSLGERGEVSVARIALGSVAPVPLRAPEAEAILEGETLEEGRIGRAAQAAAAACSPISDVRAGAGYRRRMAEVHTRRALTQAWNELQGGRRDG